MLNDRATARQDDRQAERHDHDVASFADPRHGHRRDDENIDPEQTTTEENCNTDSNTVVAVRFVEWFIAVLNLLSLGLAVSSAVSPTWLVDSQPRVEIENAKAKSTNEWLRSSKSSTVGMGIFVAGALDEFQDAEVILGTNYSGWKYSASWVLWSELDSTNACDSSTLLYKDWTRFYGLCDEEGRYQTPSRVSGLQTLSILTIFLVFIATMLSLVAAVRGGNGKDNDSNSRMGIIAGVFSITAMIFALSTFVAALTWSYYREHLNSEIGRIPLRAFNSNGESNMMLPVYANMDKGPAFAFMISVLVFQFVAAIFSFLSAETIAGMTTTATTWRRTRRRGRKEQNSSNSSSSNRVIRRREIPSAGGETRTRQTQNENEDKAARYRQNLQGFPGSRAYENISGSVFSNSPDYENLSHPALASQDQVRLGNLSSPQDNRKRTRESLRYNSADGETARSRTQSLSLTHI